MSLGSVLRAPGTSALVVPKGFMPAAVFLIFPGKAFPGSFTVQGEVLRTPVLEAEEEPLVLPGFPGSSQSVVSAWRDQPAPTTSWNCAGTFLAGHGVLLNPLQMEQMSPPFPYMRQCGV